MRIKKVKILQSHGKINGIDIFTFPSSMLKSNIMRKTDD